MVAIACHEYSSQILPLQQKVTPLFKASQNGHTAVVKLLLEAKAKPDLQDEVILTEVGYLNTTISSIMAVISKI